MGTRTTLIIGGKGKTGRRVADRLQAHGVPVRIGSRSGEPPFDWGKPMTWKPALQGVKAAYVTYQPDLAFPGAAEQVERLARLAVDSGVRRLVLLSGRNEEGAVVAEQAVRGSGAEWTLIRSSFMNQNFDEGFWLEAVLSGEFAFVGGEVREPFIDAGDIADIAAESLMSDRHVGRLYEVTGPRLMTFAQAVGEIAEATGRKLRYKELSMNEYADSMKQAGLPPEQVSAYVELFTSVLDGRNEYLTDGVQQALSRAPRHFRDYASEAAATGAWGSVALHRRGGSPSGIGSARSSIASAGSS